jgi:hypothetical protein
MGPKHAVQNKEEQIVHAFRRNDSYEKIVGEQQTLNHRIARVAKSIHDSGEVPPPKSIGRLSKMTPEVIDLLCQTATYDPLLGGKSLSHLVAEKLHLAVSAQTLDLIRSLLRFRHTSPCRHQLPEILNR